jgi:mRNA interferase MazF
MTVKRFEVYQVNLDPTIGKEIKKARPCLVISPDEINRFLATVIVAPTTTQKHEYPSRVTCKFQGKDGQIVLDQIRAVDKSRLAKKIGKIDGKTQTKVLEVLSEMFSP